MVNDSWRQYARRQENRFIGNKAFRALFITVQFLLCHLMHEKKEKIKRFLKSSDGVYFARNSGIRVESFFEATEISQASGSQPCVRFLGMLVERR